MKNIMRKNKTGINAAFFLFGGNLFKIAPKMVEPTIDAPSNAIGI